MRLYIVMFFATFGYVALRAFQQLNVTGHKYVWIVPTSYGMACLDIFCVYTVAREGLGWQLILTNGTASVLGCFLSMWIHKRFVTK